MNIHAHEPWTIHAIYIKFTIYMKFTWNLHEIYMKFTWNVHAIYMNVVLHENNMKITWKLHEIYMKCTRHEGYIKRAWNLHLTWHVHEFCFIQTTQAHSTHTSDMKLTWKLHEVYSNIFSQMTSAQQHTHFDMQLTWNLHENYMKMTPSRTTRKHDMNIKDIQKYFVDESTWFNGRFGDTMVACIVCSLWRAHWCVCTVAAGSENAATI